MSRIIGQMFLATHSMQSAVLKFCYLIGPGLLFAACLTGPPDLPEDSGEGPCRYELQVDGQQRTLNGACPPISISALWKSLPSWFQARFQLHPDEVLRNKLRLYSGPGVSRALVIDGKRYDLVSPDLKVRSETRIIIE